MPSLIQKHKEMETVAKLKKFASVMSQAMTMAVQNEGEISNWGLAQAGTGLTDEDKQNAQASKIKFRDTIVKYLKYTEYNPIVPESAIYDRYSLDGTKFSNFATIIVLADGTNIVGHTITHPDCNYAYGTSTALQNVCGEFFVDLNGKKGPNATGKDVFLFYYSKNGNITPVGTAAETSYRFDNMCNRNKSDKLNGYGCTAWVMYNENMDYLHCDDLNWQGKHKCKQ